MSIDTYKTIDIDNNVDLNQYCKQCGKCKTEAEKYNATDWYRGILIWHKGLACHKTHTWLYRNVPVEALHYVDVK